MRWRALEAGNSSAEALADFAPSSGIAQEYRRAAEQILDFLDATR